ncbi:MAG: hypothetical protein CM1200mP28_15280 [Deltaproteobacteria bacterium]|nr:MAG: hypothetical protein CM1200mP28_15280 [Deltaproteobacteria bacterium]
METDGAILIQGTLLDEDYFIDYKYDEELNIQPDYIATSIQDATQWVIENHN